MSSGSVVSGAGAFEVAVADALVKHKPNVKGRAQLGVQAFADALLVIPKVKNNSFSLSFLLTETLFVSCCTIICHLLTVHPVSKFTDVFKMPSFC